LEPKFRSMNIQWDGVAKVLVLIIIYSKGSLVPLQEAYDDPDEFYKKLQKFDVWGDAVAIKWAEISSRPGLEPLLLKSGLVWEDMLRTMQTITSASKIKRAVDEPEKFITDFLDKSYDLTGRVWAIARLRPFVAPCLPEGIPYEDLYRVLGEFQTVRELRTYQDSPAYLVGKLRDNQKWAPSLAYCSVKVRPATEPKLAEGVLWEDFVRVLWVLDPLKEIALYTTDWLKLTKKCEADSEWLPSRYWAIAHLRPKIEVRIQENGGTWEEAFPLLETMDVGMDLWPALKDPADILKKLAE